MQEHDLIANQCKAQVNFKIYVTNWETNNLIIINMLPDVSESKSMQSDTELWSVNIIQETIFLKIMEEIKQADQFHTSFSFRKKLYMKSKKVAAPQRFSIHM